MRKKKCALWINKGSSANNIPQQTTRKGWMCRRPFLIIVRGPSLFGKYFGPPFILLLQHPSVANRTYRDLKKNVSHNYYVKLFKAWEKKWLRRESVSSYSIRPLNIEGKITFDSCIITRGCIIVRLHLYNMGKKGAMDDEHPQSLLLPFCAQQHVVHGRTGLVIQ